MSRRLSVTIIAKNEALNIERCLNSVRWADEILVVDSGSTDDTLDICRKHKCRIIEHEWLGFGPMKQFAVDAATHDWILSIDADEVLTEPLINRIQTILNHTQYNSYHIKRKSFYLGKMIDYCGWQRDYPLRLFNRQFGRFNNKQVHESVTTSGNSDKIQEAILHYTYPTIQSHAERMNRYAELGAQQLYEKGKSSTISNAVLRGIVKFFKMYVLNLGFLDSKVGFVLCYNSAFGVYQKYIRLWELNRS